MIGYKTLTRSLNRLDRDLESRGEVIEGTLRLLVYRTIDCVMRGITGLSFKEMEDLLPEVLERLGFRDRKELADAIRADAATVERIRGALAAMGNDVPPCPNHDLPGFVRRYEARHGQTLLLGDQPDSQ